MPLGVSEGCEDSATLVRFAGGVEGGSIGAEPSFALIFVALVVESSVARVLLRRLRLRDMLNIEFWNRAENHCLPDSSIRCQAYTCDLCLQISAACPVAESSSGLS